MEIEEVAHKTPEKILKEFVDPLVGLTDEQAARLARGIGVPEASVAKAVILFKNLYTCYMDTDASLAEINPLILEGDGNIKALDAKFNFDANALFRHPEIVAYRDLDEENPDEIEASKFDLAYISLDGNIGCLVNGAGLAMWRPCAPPCPSWKKFGCLAASGTSWKIFAPVRGNVFLQSASWLPFLRKPQCGRRMCWAP